MQPAESNLWSPVPGYSTEDEEEGQDTGEPSQNDIEERLGEVHAALGLRFTDRPLIQFQAVPMAGGRNPAVVAASQTQSASRGRWTAPLFHLHSDAPMLRETFLSNGMMPTNQSDFALHWSGPNIKDSVYQSMNEWQRINHFPGSTELTRKDRLWHHFVEMANSYGSGCFDFVPESYVLPEQVDDFLACYERTKYSWIVKPNASSRGRGIFMLRDLSELPLEETMVVSRYIDNPLLIQGLKFDLRVYVLVTSFEPLKAYIYREGITRFASKPYSMKDEHMQDAFRHLTNYSINKNSCKFVENSDLRADNVGHKWSLSALNKHLRCVGIDVNLMWVRINDLIVKSLLAVEPSVSARARQMTPNRENCFELYGFDVLVDDELKPWLLEVNLSPSMQAESPLDWQIKSSLVADTFNLVGICASDRPQVKPVPRSSLLPSSSSMTRQQGSSGAAEDRRGTSKARSPNSEKTAMSDPEWTDPPLVLNALSDSQLKILAKSLGERTRYHNFVPLYPTRKTVKRYSLITEARATARAPQIFRNLGNLLGGSSKRLTPSQMLASLLYGPRPVRSAAEMRSRSMPLQRAGTVCPGDSSPSNSPDASPSAGDEEFADDNPQDLDAAFGTTSEGYKDVLAVLGPPSAAEGAAALSAATASELPASVQDPDVPLRAREVALVAATRSLRLLCRSGRQKRRWKGLPKADEEEEDDGTSEEEEVDDDADEDGGKRMSSSCGCRLLLMEYLVRLEAACEGLGAVGRARLAQSSSYGRLFAFQKRLPTVAAKLALARDVGTDNTVEARTSDRGGLIDDLASSCRDGLEILERLTWREAGAAPDEDGPAAEETEDAGEESEAESSPNFERAGVSKHRLPRSILRKKPCQKLLKALPHLGASELEWLLRSSLCAGGSGPAAALRPLFDAFADCENLDAEDVEQGARSSSLSAGLPGSAMPGKSQLLPDLLGESQPSAGRRNRAAEQGPGPKSTGPLSELLRAAVQASRMPRTTDRQHRRGRVSARPSFTHVRPGPYAARPGSRAGKVVQGSSPEIQYPAKQPESPSGGQQSQRPEPPEVLKDPKVAYASGIMLPPRALQTQSSALRRSIAGTKQRVSLIAHSKSSPVLPELASTDAKEAPVSSARARGTWTGAKDMAPMGATTGSLHPALGSYKIDIEL